MRPTCVLLVAALAASLGSAATDPDPLTFTREQRERRHTRTPREVLAFYYTWYGTPDHTGRWIHWEGVDLGNRRIASSTHYPAEGPYDSHDPAVIARHIRQAKRAGITGFIATWWGRGDFTDQAVLPVLDEAARQGFKVTLYWESAGRNDEEQVMRAVSDLVYILEQYGSHPAFLTVDAKPVIFVYGRVMEQVPLSSWPAIVTQARARYGQDFLLIADGYSGAYARLFDGIHTYNVCGWVQGQSPGQLVESSGRSFRSAVSIARQQAKISCITIIPGYDDTRIRTPGINAERHDGQTYQLLWEQAIAADPDWVLITSFNEWHEGSELEPSLEFGDEYLRLTQAPAERFVSTPYSSAALPEQPAGIDAQRAAHLRAAWADTTIALLPHSAGEVTFFLLDAGLHLRGLTWDDVVDPDLLDPHALPVVIYAGSEDYTRSVRTEGDVDAALQRYLSAGGVLVVAPHQPAPFFYDHNGKHVRSAWRLGVPMDGSGAVISHQSLPAGATHGWEQPPAGLALSFEINQRALPSLPASALFPTDGDLRWRPANRVFVAEGDVYTPLATLVDADGNSYGDGIAWVEHRFSEPRGGRVLYVWMRMPDALGRDDLLCELFGLLARRLSLVRIPGDTMRIAQESHIKSLSEMYP